MSQFTKGQKVRVFKSARCPCGCRDGEFIFLGIDESDGEAVIVPVEYFQERMIADMPYDEFAEMFADSSNAYNAEITWDDPSVLEAVE